MTNDAPKPPRGGDTDREAARLRYETFPGTTFESVAAEFGLASRTLKRWSKSDPNGEWKKIASRAVTEDAHKAADRIGKAMANASTDEQRQAAAEAARLEAAVDERAKVISRHRSEPAIIRKLIGDAVRSNDPTKARMANDVGRPLQTCHNLERRAWGIDIDDQHNTIVIERD